MRAFRWFIFVICLIAIPCCWYEVFYLFWLSATPLTPNQLARVHFEFYFWIVAGVFSIVAAVVALAGALPGDVSQER